MTAPHSQNHPLMKHFLSLADITTDQFNDLMDLAITLKRELKNDGKNRPLLAGKNLGMIFQKPSLRTRVSFEVGMNQLGGAALYLSPNEIQLGKRESVADVARVLGRYVNGIMARVFAHQDVVDLAAYSPVPVINGLSDYNHPCQGLADYLTMLEAWGSFEGRTLAYVGDGNNVLTSLINGAIHTGMTIHAATPEGYEPPADVLEYAKQRGVTVNVFTDPRTAVEAVDALYTDALDQHREKKNRAPAQACFTPCH